MLIFCALENGWTCNAALGQITTCVPNCVTAAGGPFNLVGYLQCEDGNTVDTDGCSNNCLINAGYSCAAPATTTTPSVCALTCGDNIIISP
ncbi:MAG: hypothetical protein IPK55_12505 [Streptococcus sp.]|nr:hypothetical protein [Streptococcus sp.]